MLFRKKLYENKIKFGNKIALETEEKRCTYEELYFHVMNTAKKILSMKKDNDTVMLCSNNSIEFVISYFAAIIAGKMVLLVDPKYNIEMINIIKEYQVHTLIVPDEIKTKIDKLCAENQVYADPYIYVNINTVMQGGGSDLDELEICIPETDFNKISVIIFTSGTEGMPKGIANSQYTLMEACKNYVSTCNITESDRFLGVTPFFHSYCMGSCMLAGIFTGAYIYVMDSFIPNKVLEKIVNYEINIFQGVPFMYDIFTNSRHVNNLCRLRLCISAGGKITRNVMDAIFTKTGIWIINEYGSSETGTIAINYPPDKPYITGRILNGVEVKLHDTDSFGRGRLAVKSEGLSLGYYKKSNRKSEYFITSDIVSFLSEDQIEVCGRCNDIINIAGLKVDTKEIEEVLLKNAKIQDCLVRKKEDEAFGECIEAIIVTNDNKLNGSAIREFCGTHLARYKIPHYIKFVSEIKKSALGKKVYTKIHEM